MHYHLSGDSFEFIFVFLGVFLVRVVFSGKLGPVFLFIVDKMTDYLPAAVLLVFCTLSAIVLEGFLDVCCNLTKPMINADFWTNLNLLIVLIYRFPK